MDESAKRAIKSDDPLALAAELGDEKPEPELLLEATRRKAKKCMALLLARGADASGFAGNLTPLHVARNAASVKVLVEAGGDVNAPAGLSNNTPLHLAAANGGAPVIKALLKAGADPNALVTVGSWDLCPVQSATQLGRSVAVRALLTKPPTPDRVARCVGEVVSRIKADGTLPPKLKKVWAALMTAPDLSGLIPEPPWRPIHMVASTASAELMQQLLDAGVDANARGGGELTAAFSVASKASVHTGKRDRCISVLKLLVAAGAELDVRCSRDPWKTNDGKTARELVKSLEIEL